MKRIIKRMALYIGLAIALMLTIPAGLPFAAAADKLVSVTGEATVSVAPDMALITLGVTAQAKTARAASDENARTMTAVFSALKEAGIAERDIHTSRLSLEAQYDRRDHIASPRVVGFQANNRVMVKVHEIDKIADILDRAIGVGANAISGIQFVVSEPSKLLDTAREEAIADAQRKAMLYAQAAGAKLGQVVSIVEQGAVVPLDGEASVLRDRSIAVPVAPGEQNLRVTVSVSYELER